MEKTVDLVVVGSAASGLSCAVKAWELGIKNIVILEKMGVAGGCSRFAGGIMGFDTPVQKRAGFYYSADDAFRDVIHLLNWNVDAKLVRKWITGTGENIRWLEEEGVVFENATAFNDRQDINRHTYHSVPVEPGSGKFTGYRIVEALTNKCREYGIDILLNTRAQHLLQDDQGRVSGVVAEGKDGEQMIVHAKAVMLGTGSMGGNKEMLREFYGTDAYDDIAVMSGFPFLTGDGIKMAEEVGGARGRISMVFIGPHNHFKGASEITCAVCRRPHGIKVNRNGERFVNEDLCSESEYGWMLSASIDRQPGKISYTIVDEALLQHMIDHRKEQIYCVDFGAISAKEIVTFGESEDLSAGKPTDWILHFRKHMEKEEAAGRAKICQSLEEVAAYIGCEPETLQETFRVYNHSCRIGNDEEFLKDPKFLFALEAPPYYVINGPTGIDTVTGGIQVDNHNRVIDKEGRHIPSLYAGGVMTSNWLNGLYAYFGTEMSYSVFSGRNAAMEISKLLKA